MAIKKHCGFLKHGNISRVWNTKHQIVLDYKWIIIISPLNTHIYIYTPSGKLTQLWKITLIHGKIHYFYGHFQ